MDEAAVGEVARPRRRRVSGGTLTALSLAAAAIVLWGGYGRDWRWTGFAHRALLWDWLHVALLPLAVAVAPLWLRHGHRLGRLRHVLLELAVGAFALLVVLGYVLPLGWTGFPGNTLWDWLELLVLPLAVALAPVWVELARGVQRVHRVAALVLLVLFVVALVGGYGHGWRWTGFEGNTLFDWLQLLVAPLLLPLVVVPFVAEWTTAVMEKDGDERAARRG